MGTSEDPQRLLSNKGRCFSGPKVDGAGFTFDDLSEDATPLAVWQRIRIEEPRSTEVVFPYLGGQELLNHPDHSPRRLVINFGDMSESEAMQYPALYEIVRSKAYDKRVSGRLANRPWWQFESKARALEESKAGLRRLLMHSFYSSRIAFAFIDPKTIVPAPHVVITLDSFAAFSALQSRTHDEWVRLVGSSMKDDLRYTPSDCFETFPLPKEFNTDPALEAAGQHYYEFRADLMIRNNEGLTKTYNRFHDPDERSPDILKLRELHAAMDRAVLDAYGWTDLKPICEFLLDYEEDDDEEEAGGGRRRKKPWRYRWPDDFRDGVLARLLELNRQRAEEERLSGAAEAGRDKPRKKSTAGRKAARKNPDQPEFFES